MSVEGKLSHGFVLTLKHFLITTFVCQNSDILLFHKYLVSLLLIFRLKACNRQFDGITYPIKCDKMWGMLS